MVNMNGCGVNLAFRGIKVMLECLGKYVKSEQLMMEEMCQGIMSAIRKYYTQEEDEEGAYKELMGCLQGNDSPVVLVKGIAESFNRDFWELWDEIKDVVCRKNQIIYGNDGYYVIPISTQELFEQNPDDMILYWEADGKLTFPEELWNWFHELKVAFADMMEEESVVEKPLRYMVDLLEEAEENFYHVFAVSDFFEECLENLNDRRYQILWRLFDKLIHDLELRKEADVIFVPEGPEHEKEGVHYWGEEPKRRLICSWDIMSHDNLIKYM